MEPPVVPFGRAVVETDAHPSLSAIVSRPPAASGEFPAARPTPARQAEPMTWKCEARWSTTFEIPRLMEDGAGSVLRRMTPVDSVIRGQASGNDPGS